MKLLWRRPQIKVMIKSLNGRIGKGDSTRRQTTTIKISISNGKAVINIILDSNSKCRQIIILNITLIRITRR